MQRFSILIFFLISLIALDSIGDRSGCWESEWVKNPPVEDEKYRYYIGRASGSINDSEKILMDHARKDSREIAIAENFGILTSVQKQSYQSLISSTALKRVSEISKNVILRGFRKKKTCWQEKEKKKHLWVLFQYSKSEIKKEQKRIEKVSFTDKKQSFSEMSTTDKKGGGFLEVVTSPKGMSVAVGDFYGKTPIRVYLAGGFP